MYIPARFYDAAAATLLELPAWDEDPPAPAFGLERPHFTEACAPSTSTPAAHAEAAVSADARSVKFTKAQRFLAT